MREVGTIGAICRVSKAIRGQRWARRGGLILGLAACSFFAACGPAASQAPAPIPDAPDPQNSAAGPIPQKVPCPRPTGNGAVSGSDLGVSPGQKGNSPAPCMLTWAQRYERFADGPQTKPLTPRDKAWLAARNVADPFNNITILGEAAIAVASDPHSAYGPGMPGYARYIGVSYTQDMVGEFIDTFLIPSVVHQDPHYHRMPGARVSRRVFHATAQVLWSLGDNGKGMPNYANIVGFAINDEISNLYVPGRETDLGASASRYVIALATAPIDNYVTEFLPDVARHIHVEIVVLQRIINQVARSEGEGQ